MQGICVNNKKVQLVSFLSDKVEYTISAAGLFLGKDLGGDRLFWLCNEVGICRFWSCDPFWRPLALWDPFRRRGLPPSQRRPRISSLCAAYFAQWPKNSQNNLMLQFYNERLWQRCLASMVGICQFWSCVPFWRALALWDPFYNAAFLHRSSGLGSAAFVQPKLFNWSILWAFGPLCRLEHVTQKQERKREELFFLDLIFLLMLCISKVVTF